MDKRNGIEPKRQSWEDLLRDKLDGYEYPIGKLPPLVLPTGKKRRRGIVPWLVATTAVAASLLLGVWLFKDPAEPIIIPVAAYDYGGGDDIVAQSPVVASVPETPLLALNRDIPTSAMDEAVAETPAEPFTITVEEGEPDEPAQEKEPAQEFDHNPKEVSPKRPVYVETSRPSRERGVTIALSVSGESVGSRTGNTSGMMQAFSVSQEVYALSQGAQKYSVQEKLPIEIGATALVPLTSRLSVESGVRYTLRRLEISSSGTLLPEEYEMDVHLLSIPVGVQYEVARFGNFGLNTSTGLSGNIPIAKSIRGEQKLEQKMSFGLDSYATLGVDYQISKSIALGASIGGVYDLVPLNEQIFNEKSSRLRLRMNMGLKFRIP